MDQVAVASSGLYPQPLLISAADCSSSKRIAKLTSESRVNEVSAAPAQRGFMWDRTILSDLDAFSGTSGQPDGDFQAQVVLKTMDSRLLPLSN